MQYRKACCLSLAFSLAILGACNGDGEEPNPADRYAGPVAPCDVRLSTDEDELPAERRVNPAWEDGRLERLELWKPGPYPTWNTHPDKGCAQNPTIPQVGEETDVDMYVTYPALLDPTRDGFGDVAEGPWPIIVFAHANNDSVCNIFERYYSLHEHWASWGYVVVAVDGTATNCQRGNRQNIEVRAEGQKKAIEAMRALNEDRASRFYGRLDLDRVILAGHSRGGGASLVSAIELGDAVRAVIDLQGVDLTAFGFGSEPILPDTPVIGITAGEDVDLNYPIVEPTEDQLAGPYTWVNINGAIHAYTADTVPIEPDDVPLIDRGQQHDVTDYYTTAFLAYHVGIGDGSASPAFAPLAAPEPILFSHQGAEVTAEILSSLGVHVRWNRRQGTVIDDFNDFSASVNRLGGERECQDLSRCEVVYTYKPDEAMPTSRWRKSRSMLLVTDEGAGRFRTTLSGDGSPLTVDADGMLYARVKGPDGGAVARFDVTIETPDGAHTVEGHAHVGPTTLTNRFAQLAIPLGDVTDITAIAFELREGALFVDDLRVAPK